MSSTLGPEGLELIPRQERLPRAKILFFIGPLDGTLPLSLGLHLCLFLPCFMFDR
jgi:hypothetical protein